MNKQELVDVTCRACNKSTHVIKECPMVCGYPNRAKVLLNYRRNIPSDRMKYGRKNERKVGTRKESGDIRNSIYLYICKKQLISDDLDGQQFIGSSSGDNNIVENENDAIIESDEVNKELVSNTLKPLNRYPTKYQIKRKLSFQACSDALCDEQIRDKILDIIASIQRAERSNKYLSHFGNQGQNQLLQYNRQKEHQTTILSNKSESDKKISDFNPQSDQKKQQKIVGPSIKVNDFSIDQLYIQKRDVDETGRMMGQYCDIFEGFDRVRIFEYFLQHNNVSQIVRNTKNKQKQNANTNKIY